ncbi:MAG: DUF1622 domain-containing protein [Chitinophagaceae bacterium]|nr:MAG: DUF1622 domain-containing protein [Chitinophagaceae bacterium]
MEEIAKTVALHLSLVVEILGAVVIAAALLQFIAGYFPALLSRKQYLTNSWLRVRFGSSLAIALELLLAADILRTAVAPTWEDIGKLAAIAAIRTALNYFLEKELKEIEKRVPDAGRDAGKGAAEARAGSAEGA